VDHSVIGAVAFLSVPPVDVEGSGVTSIEKLTQGFTRLRKLYGVE
jgi:hypothetical protein